MSATILDRVGGFVARLAPEPICDDCIAAKLELAAREHANRKTRELAGSAGFERQLGECALCGKTKKVIRKKRR